MSGTSDQDDLADRIVARLEASFQAMLREAIAADRAERSEPADAVFNTNQAAKILNISAERLRRLCRAEQITFHLHRGRYSFSSERSGRVSGGVPASSEISLSPLSGSLPYPLE